MKYLIQIITLLLLVSCKTTSVVNNAKPPVDREAVNNIANASEIATRTWVPWYLLLIIFLTIILVSLWKEKHPK